MQLNEVSSATRAIFADVRATGKRVLERFYQGFAAALSDVCPDWKHLKPRERKTVFEKVQDTAKAVIVDVRDGGHAHNGLGLGTFYGYVCKIKRAHIYGVPLSVAERATNQELQQAQQLLRGELKTARGTHERRMVRAYELVKQRQVESRERLRREVEQGTGTRYATFTATAVLPNPAQYQSADEDSKALLETGIQNMLSWLRSESLKPHLQKNLVSAKLLRAILAQLTRHEKR